MSVHLVVKNSSPPSASPYRLLDHRGREVAWVNQFLDAQKLRQLSLRSLRIYAYDLLHVARWFQNTRHSLARLNQSLLLDYVRYQLDQQPSPAPQTINHRLGVLRCLYRFHYGQEIPGKAPFQRTYTTRSSLGYGRRHTKITSHLQLRQPRRGSCPSRLIR
jgi:Phage integrase, N-terminal SAM-like domain